MLTATHFNRLNKAIATVITIMLSETNQMNGRYVGFIV